MAQAKKTKKLRLHDDVEKVTAPWQAWYHQERKRKFYINTITKESSWDHPDTLKETKPKVASQPVTPLKKNEVSRKRKENQTVEEPMEIDKPQPPKRRHREDTEDIAPEKKLKSENSIHETIPSISMPTQSTSQSCSATLAPVVPWSSKTHPYYRFPYKGVAIFDTCSLLEDCTALDTAVEKQCLAVIPYAVLTELDGLKNNPDTRPSAMFVTRRFKEIRETNPFFIRMETSSEKRIEAPNYIPDQSLSDDAILKCALRTKAEVLSISDELGLNSRAIIFVTNDEPLTNKASAHDLISEKVESFVATITGKVLEKKPPKPRKSAMERRKEPIESKKRKSKQMNALEEKRSTEAWIASMTPKYTGVRTRQEAPKSRPSIPLAEEHSPQKSHKPLSNYIPKPYVSNNYQRKSEVQLDQKPSKIRPRMPLSISDDEKEKEQEEEEDGMDCS
uniref:WW domain-containing protein n=1 Tax=Caenorhabditis japonica TaxID=281687 RepID=A0A8R1DMA5_CAEJA